ncbi:hypothetical protein AB0K05_20885 [Nonomuraea sp. NPDC049486]|uniref:hypothetical protein n=1 Tax=Nonomuraea sp. NPDC049486 TaxID=3155773 RepID=UPI0034290DF7
MPTTELLIIATTLAILAAGATILIKNRNTRGRTHQRRHTSSSHETSSTPSSTPSSSRTR